MCGDHGDGIHMVQSVFSPGRPSGYAGDHGDGTKFVFISKCLIIANCEISSEHSHYFNYKAHYVYIRICMHISYADTIIENAIQVKLLELNFSRPYGIALE